MHAQCCIDTHADVIHVYPGILAHYNSFEEDQHCFHHEASSSIMEINHCHFGRMGWDLRNGTSIYMGEGDLSLHSAALCSDSTMHFPLGSYQGLTFTIDFEILEKHVPELLRESPVDLHRIREAFCHAEHSTLFSSNEKVEHIFAPLYHLPEDLQLPYLRLKIQELLLFLNRQTSAPAPSATYNSDTTEIIRRIHTQLISDLEHRYTIPELSARYLVNTSTLKEVFKAVYGMPIAAYMKEYRIRHAARLLRHTESSIADIAAQVGYETQSKFTKAFKETLGITPSDYRRQ